MGVSHPREDEWPTRVIEWSNNYNMKSHMDSLKTLLYLTVFFCFCLNDTNKNYLKHFTRYRRDIM